MVLDKTKYNMRTHSLHSTQKFIPQLIARFRPSFDWDLESNVQFPIYIVVRCVFVSFPHCALRASVWSRTHSNSRRCHTVVLSYYSVFQRGNVFRDVLTFSCHRSWELCLPAQESGAPIVTGFPGGWRQQQWRQWAGWGAPAGWITKMCSLSCRESSGAGGRAGGPDANGMWQTLCTHFVSQSCTGNDTKLNSSFYFSLMGLFFRSSLLFSICKN